MGPLHHHAPEPRPVHPHRLQHVRHADAPRRQRCSGPERITEAEDVHDVGVMNEPR